MWDMGMEKFNTNLEKGKKFILFCSSQWGGGNGRNTIENVRSHLSQNFPKKAIKTMHIPFRIWLIFAHKL